MVKVIKGQYLNGTCYVIGDDVSKKNKNYEQLKEQGAFGCEGDVENIEITNDSKGSDLVLAKKNLSIAKGVVTRKEKALDKREAGLDTRETELDEREEALDEKEAELEKIAENIENGEATDTDPKGEEEGEDGKKEEQKDK